MSDSLRFKLDEPTPQVPIHNLRQTCPAFPAQWEGELNNGNFLYVRYRHETFAWGIGKTIGEAVDDCDKHYWHTDESPWMTEERVLYLLAKTWVTSKELGSDLE